MDDKVITLGHKRQSSESSDLASVEQMDTVKVKDEPFVSMGRQQTTCISTPSSSVSVIRRGGTIVDNHMTPSSSPNKQGNVAGIGERFPHPSRQLNDKALL